MPAKTQSQVTSKKVVSLDSQVESHTEQMLESGVGTFALSGVLEHSKSFGTTHVFTVGLYEVVLFGRSGDYAVGHFCGQLCEVSGRLEVREYNGRHYPQFVVNSCWPVR